MFNLKKAKDYQSKFVINIAKDIVAKLDMKHIDFNNLFFVRSDVQNSTEDSYIYKLPRELIKTFDIYYVIVIYPEFDLLKEYAMYRRIFHVLSKIPKDYKTRPRLLKPDIIMFTNEYLFDENFKDNLGLKR